MKKSWVRKLAVFLSLALILSVCHTDVSVSAATKKKVSVSKVTVTKPTTSVLTMKKGTSYTLKYTISPKNATNKSVKFTSSNKKVVTVSSKGKVKALKAGTARVTITTANKKKDSIIVKVGTKVTSVSLNKTAITLTKGSTTTLKATVKPSTATYKKVKYSTNNSRVATVSQTGKITAKANGTARIYVKALDGSGKYKYCKVTVVTKVSSVKLNKTSLSLTKGSSATLTATVSPSTASNKGVRFTTNKSTVATVSSTGKVTAKGVGTARIYAKATDGSGKYTYCLITVKEKPVTPSPSPSPSPSVSPSPVPSESPSPAPSEEPEDGYSLVFEDDFNGTELNKDNWNYETHDPGWVNNELQEYTDSDENIYVKDGNLVIKAKKETKEVNGEEKDWYTSGKINSKNKQNFKYGKFEIRAKGVEGQGLWPAIWMMPENENFYGQWPRCGEIDIMEILGHEPNKTYSTIHYGNPHQEQQGYVTLEEGSFADDYHVWSLDWEPGSLKFYVDGQLVKSMNDWYTATEGKGEVTFPAPFDQFFYLQFNMAIGGNWPGNPDATTNFDNAEFMVDYVKVYQKDEYDENVTKPEKPPVVLRDPDATGNYVVNGDFATQEDLTDDTDWGVKFANGGVADVTLEDNQMVIKTENAGSVTYSVQIVQPNIPMKKGGQYKLSFDAYADEARTMITDITGPDKSYVRYLEDTTLDLTTEKQSYEYTFTMEKDDDANGRLEFNLGFQNSTANVYISNVRLVKTGEIEIQEPGKTILSDGNYVYNGEFQEGTGRMQYWEVTKPDAATVNVTNDNGRRELMVSAPEGTSLDDVLVYQDVAINGGKTYALSFDAYADSEKTIEVRIDGQKFEANLTAEKQQFKYVFDTSADITEKDLVFALGNAGITYLDNVRLAEDGLLVNGDFTSDFAGWEAFVDSGANVSYTVDSQKENQAAAFEIKNTGSQDWQVQLMQNGVKLEEGKWYELTFQAKTDLEGGRDIGYAIQRNGTEDDDWTPYSGNGIAALTGDYQTFSVKFKMAKATDENARLSFSMGAVGSVQITDTHNVYIDNVTLEETEPVEIEVPVVEGNMLQNADFTLGEDGFENWEKAVTAPGEAEMTAVENGVSIAITNVGEADHNVQLKQLGLGLIQGHKYELKMTVTSDVARTIKAALMTSSYDWYGGADLALTVGENVITQTIDVSKDTSNDIGFFLSLGLIENEETPVGTIQITGLSLVDVTEGDKEDVTEDKTEDVTEDVTGDVIA